MDKVGNKLIKKLINGDIEFKKMETMVKINL